MTDPTVKKVCDLSWFCDSRTGVFWIGWFGVKYPRGFEVQPVVNYSNLEAEGRSLQIKYRREHYTVDTSLRWLEWNPYEAIKDSS